MPSPSSPSTSPMPYAPLHGLTMTSKRPPLLLMHKTINFILTNITKPSTTSRIFILIEDSWSLEEEISGRKNTNMQVANVDSRAVVNTDRQESENIAAGSSTQKIFTPKQEGPALFLLPLHRSPTQDSLI